MVLSATALSSRVISSDRSVTFREISEAALRTSSSCSWRSASVCRLVSIRPAIRNWASLSRAGLGFELIALGLDVRHYPGEFRQPAGQFLGLRAQLGKRAGEQHGTAHHLQGVLALGDDHRRRVAPHALHCREQARDLAVPLGERALQQLLLAFELVATGFDRRHLAFRALDQAGGFLKVGIESSAVGVHLGDVGLQLLGFLLRRLEPLAIGLQGLRWVLGAGGGRGQQYCQRTHRQPRPVEPGQGNAAEALRARRFAGEIQRNPVNP